jgi:hypothetical protein
MMNVKAEPITMTLVAQPPKFLRKENLQTEGIVAVARYCEAMSVNNMSFNFVNMIDASIHGILDSKIRNWRELEPRVFFDKLLKQYKPSELAPTATLVEQIRQWPNQLFFVDPWNTNCLDALFYKVEYLVRINGYQEAMPPAKVKELIDALNDRLCKSFDRGGDNNPCIVMGEHMKLMNHVKSWTEWFSYVWDELNRQNVICHESTRLGNTLPPLPVHWSKLNSGYYPNRSWHNPRSAAAESNPDSSPQRFQKSNPARAADSAHSAASVKSERGHEPPGKLKNSLSVLVVVGKTTHQANVNCLMTLTNIPMPTRIHGFDGLNPLRAKLGMPRILPSWHAHGTRP